MPERTDALVGSMLGKDYRVLEPIGVGGMAVVYLVEHQTLLKRFAAKVLSSALATWLLAAKRHAGHRGGLVAWRDRVAHDHHGCPCPFRRSLLGRGF
jgi:hypothetical protein